MPAFWIFCLARTSRLAMVGSLDRNARAISAVVSPASVRRVSATRASSERAGWQQVNISRSRSSGTPLSSSSASGRLIRQHGGHLPELGRADRPAAQHVDGAVARRGGQPRAGPARDAVARPALQGQRERVLRALLGQVPVAGGPDQRGHHLAPLLPERRVDRRGDGVAAHGSIGRTSIVP